MTTRVGRTIVDDGTFRNLYRRCRCCAGNYHMYHYPYNKRTKVRTLLTCISCQRDCRSQSTCQLGVMH